MSGLVDESIELPSNSSRKHPHSDNDNALLPHSKKLRIADEKTTTPYVTPIDQDTHGFFCAIKRLPGEMRNEIYDAVLALMRLTSTAPLIQANKCAIRTGRKAKGDNEGRSQRECRQLLLRDIENCALRLVPGLRDELTTRLWNCVNIRFCSFDVEHPPFEHDYSFLRAARVAKITYQAHRDHYYIRDGDDTFLWAKPFVQALEQMEFYGTVKLTGWKYDVGLASALFERVQKYWRLGNTVDAACYATRQDGVWCLEKYPCKCYDSVQRLYKSVTYLGRPRA